MDHRTIPALFAIVFALSMFAQPRVTVGQSSPDVDRTIELTGKEYKFEPQQVDVQTGERVKIIFKNEGTIAHDFHIKELEFKTEPIQPGNSTTYTFTASEEPTTLKFACKVAGHEPAGMNGQIKVRKGNDKSTSNSSSEQKTTESSEEGDGKTDQKNDGEQKLTLGEKANQHARKQFKKRRNAKLKDGWGAVKGQVVLEGKQPEPYQNEGAKVFENQCDLEGSFKIQHVQVNEENQGIRDALVYVKDLDAKHTDLLPPKTSRIVQDKCLFHPSVQVIRTGGSIELVNNDPAVHNFKYDGLGDSNFEQGNLTQRGASGKTVVDRIQIKTPGVYSSICNVHPWMNGLFLAVDHHAYDVTGNSGKFRIQLPPGTYTFHVRHYTQKEAKTVKVNIPEGKEIEKEIKVKLNK